MAEATVYGTLTDYTAGQPIRPATRDEWDMTAKSLDAGEDLGVWRDDAIYPHPVYVDGGPDPIVSDQAIRDFQDEAGSFGDLDQVAMCERALDGDTEARAECAGLIRDYRCREAEALA